MNLTSSEIRSNILTHFSTNYTATPVIYTPTEIDTEIKKSPFVILDYNFGNSYSVMKGSGAVTRHTGVIFVSIFVPLIQVSATIKKGGKQAFELADVVLATLERKRLNNSDVVTRSGSIDIDEESDNYYKVVISIPFYVS